MEFQTIEFYALTVRVRVMDEFESVWQTCVSAHNSIVKYTKEMVNVTTSNLGNSYNCTRTD